MRNPLCLLLTIWRTLRTGVWLRGQIVSGHSYVIEEPAPANIQLLKCEVCGHYDATWCWPHAISKEWMAAKGHSFAGPMKIVPISEMK